VYGIPEYNLTISFRPICMTSSSPDQIAALRELEDKVAMFDDWLKRMMEQTVALSQIVLERAKKDEEKMRGNEVRMAKLEAQRVVHMLSRAEKSPVTG
jgi:hypothetical protein